MSEVLKSSVTQEAEGKRLDVYLAEIFLMKRAKVQALIKEGKVSVDEKVIKKPSTLVKMTQEVALLYEEEVKEALTILPEKLPLDIYYEDEELIVLCKPRGMVVYPTETSPKGTLVNGLLAYTDKLSTLSGNERPGIVHRLDKDTSGLMVVAKTNFSHKKLVEGFSAHRFSRYYEGIVYGKPQNECAKIILPIARDKKYRTRMAVDEEGKEAITTYRVRESNGKFSLVNFSLETGRTHQIRVHMAYLGHSLYGDSVYGNKKNERLEGQALHAYKLVFTHPKTDEVMVFRTPVQAYFKDLCEALYLDYKEGDEEFVK